MEYIQHKHRHSEESYFVYDFDELKRLVKMWKMRLPNVTPYYAVKCNPDKRILSFLAEQGIHFDCASMSEIETVLSLHVDSSRILFANPCKRKCDLHRAYELGIQNMTFDSICELEKIANIIPYANLILRIYANDPSAQCVLSNKFGAYEEEWQKILARAEELDMSIVGVSFHVGSGASDAKVYYHALQQAHTLVQMGKDYGHNMDIIDIGGGFSVRTFDAIAQEVEKGCEDFFPNDEFHVIAEPGRLFVETVATLYTKIIGKREVRGHTYYWITDSLYGSFNCIVYDHANPQPQIASGDKTTISTIYGPTCDGFDIIMKDVLLPPLDVGNTITFPNMGAYTIAGGSCFNGIPFPNAKKYYVSETIA